MKLILKQNKINNVHIRWANQYPDEKLDIREALERLNPKTQKEVDRIIGNGSWTINNCYECGKDVEVLIALGNDNCDDSPNVFICKKCLRKAMKLMNSIK